METKEFTISSVFFATTGSVAIAPDASEEYKKRAREEIKNDAVYSYILSDIPEHMRFYDEMFPDYDPIVRQFICANSVEMKNVLLRYSKKSSNDDTPVIQENITIPLSKITLEEYKSYKKIADGKVKRKNEKILNKELKKKKLRKERSRYKED